MMFPNPSDNRMILCIDTITPESCIGLVPTKGQPHFVQIPTQHSSESLFGALDDLFGKARIAPKDVKGVVVLRGPGSFTSARVGVSFANAFAHPLRLPIAGFTTDEWARHKTDEKDFVYLQSMNRDEMYAIGVGRHAKALKSSIIPVAELPEGRIQWIGFLTEDHLSRLPKGYNPIQNLRSASDGWAQAISTIDFGKPKKAYELVEPYYAKAPHITPNKRFVSISKFQ